MDTRKPGAVTCSRANPEVQPYLAWSTDRFPRLDHGRVDFLHFPGAPSEPYHAHNSTRRGYRLHCHRYPLLFGSSLHTALLYERPTLMPQLKEIQKAFSLLQKWQKHVHHLLATSSQRGCSTLSRARAGGAGAVHQAPSPGTTLDIAGSGPMALNCACERLGFSLTDVLTG